MCGGIITVSNNNSMKKKSTVCTCEKGLGFFGCYMTIQKNPQNERLPWGGCSYHYRSTDVRSSRQQAVEKHRIASLYLLFLLVLCHRAEVTILSGTLDTTVFPICWVTSNLWLLFTGVHVVIFLKARVWSSSVIDVMTQSTGKYTAYTADDFLYPFLI